MTKTNTISELIQQLDKKWKDSKAKQETMPPLTELYYVSIECKEVGSRIAAYSRQPTPSYDSPYPYQVTDAITVIADNWDIGVSHADSEWWFFDNCGSHWRAKYGQPNGAEGMRIAAELHRLAGRRENAT